MDEFSEWGEKKAALEARGRMYTCSHGRCGSRREKGSGEEFERAAENMAVVVWGRRHNAKLTERMTKKIAMWPETGVV